MHEPSVTGCAAPHTPAEAARRAGTRALAQALHSARADTLATFQAYERALPALEVPFDESLNPPLWELGHVGWFQSWWITRHPGWRDGAAADPLRPRGPEWRLGADRWYDSSTVAHEHRWALPLPDARTTRGDLEGQLAGVLDRLATVDDQAPSSDAHLYFFRLVLLHEDMHHEAALYMAQTLGIAIDDPRWQPSSLPEPGDALPVGAGRVQLGRSAQGAGFAFDNELGTREVSLAPFEIDPQAVRWCEFLPFVEEGGYDEPRWWSAPGWAWRTRAQAAGPRVVRRAQGRAGALR